MLKEGKKPGAKVPALHYLRLHLGEGFGGGGRRFGLAIVVDRHFERLEHADRIVLFALGEAVEERLDFCRRDRFRFVHGLVLGERRENRASGDAETAAGREIRNVLDPIALADLEIERVHVAANLRVRYGGILERAVVLAQDKPVLRAFEVGEHALLLEDLGQLGYSLFIALALEARRIFARGALAKVAEQRRNAFLAFFGAQLVQHSVEQNAVTLWEEALSLTGERKQEAGLCRTTACARLENQPVAFQARQVLPDRVRGKTELFGELGSRPRTMSF